MLKVVGFLLLCMCTFVFAEEDKPCLEDRARRLNATLTTTASFLHLIPSCDENGDYSALQCFTGIDWCVCYRRNGDNINTPSMSIKSCDCVRARDDAITQKADYVPKCNRAGYYLPKQCNRRSNDCWCVDRDGNKVDRDC